MKYSSGSAAALKVARKGTCLAGLAFGLLAQFVLPLTSSAGTADEAKPRLRLPAYEAQSPAEGTGGSLSLPRFSLANTAAPSLGDGDAGDDSLSRSIAPWAGLGHNALAIFAGPNAILHLSALAVSVLIVETGLDTQVHNFFVRHAAFDKFASPSVSIGSNFPVYLGVGVLGSGLIGGSSRLVSAGGAVLQASLLALCYTTTLKALTGRPGPDGGVIYTDNEASQTFRFGILRGGVYHGWPSGHMLANTAAVTSLLSFYHHSLWLKIAGGAYLGYLWMGVVSHRGSGMHWFSDTLAGVVMGYAIGSTVGRNFRERWESKSEKHGGLSLNVIPQLLTVSFDIPI